MYNVYFFSVEKKGTCQGNVQLEVVVEAVLVTRLDYPTMLKNANVIIIFNAIFSVEKKGICRVNVQLEVAINASR